MRILFSPLILLASARIPGAQAATVAPARTASAAGP